MTPSARTSTCNSKCSGSVSQPTASRFVPDPFHSRSRLLFVCLLAAAAVLFAPASPSSLLRAQQIDFGDDSSRWAHDGVCDDNRFTGDDEYVGLTGDRYVGHDASDCKDLFNKDRIHLRTRSPRSAASNTAPDFGDDRSIWAQDGQCDDNRFTGSEEYLGVTGGRHVRHDATDCRQLFAQGHIRLKGANTSTAASALYGRQDTQAGCFFGECPDDVPSRPAVTDSVPNPNYPVPNPNYPVPNPNYRIAEACQVYYPYQFWCTVPANSGYVGQSCWCPSVYGLVSGYAVAR